MKDVVENKTGSPGIQCLRREWAEVLTSHYNTYCSRASATHFASKFQNYTCALKSVQCLHPTRMKVSTNNLWECSKNIIYALRHRVKFKLSDLITWHKTTDFSLPFCDFGVQRKSLPKTISQKILPLTNWVGEPPPRVAFTCWNNAKITQERVYSLQQPRV